MKKEIRYFHAIDGLRLLASINIVLFHYCGIGGLNDLNGKPGWLFTIIKGPMFHASMFFILGGFIFTVKFADKTESFQNLPFWKKRFWDLYPLHAITTLGIIPLIFLKTGTALLSFPHLVYSTVIHLTFMYSLVPMNWLPLNRPSWALSGFFFCYLLFKPFLRFVCTLNKQSHLLIILFLCATPSLGWGLLYGQISGNDDIYFFFHIFAPIRVVEFFAGMLLARLFLINNVKALSDKRKWRGIVDDLTVVICVGILFLMLVFKKGQPSVIRFISYHTMVLPFYGILIYTLCRARGFISRIFAFPFICWIGRSSFYPYLLHIPLISWLCWYCENKLGYKTFMHHPHTLIIFMAVLYTGSAWVWHKQREIARQKKLV